MTSLFDSQHTLKKKIRKIIKLNLLNDIVAKKLEHTDATMTTRVLVRDIMNSPVITAGPTDTVVDIAMKMKEHNVGSVIITENEKPIGIVTDWDVVSNVVASNLELSSIDAAKVMKPIHTVEAGEGITEAARILRKNNIKRLGVVYKDRLAGIISASDVIAVTPELVDVVSEKAAMIRGEMGRPASAVSGYCDDCGEWSDVLMYSEGTFTCEVCRGS
jgi:CBS domain-containing protein